MNFRQVDYLTALDSGCGKTNVCLTIVYSLSYKINKIGFNYVQIELYDVLIQTLRNLKKTERTSKQN